MPKTSKSNIIKVVALGAVAYMVLNVFKKKDEAQKGFIGAPFIPSPSTPSTPIAPMPPYQPSGYVISRGQYSFTARSQYEAELLNDFLGINPAGVDLNTYISHLDSSGLAAWKSYWIEKFSSVQRQDIVEFVQQKYLSRVFVAPVPTVTISPIVVGDTVLMVDVGSDWKNQLGTVIRILEGGRVLGIRPVNLEGINPYTELQVAVSGVRKMLVV